MMGMTREELNRAIAMWGIAMCLLSAASGWVFLRFGQAWSIADLPVSGYVNQIIPAYVVTEVAMIPIGGKIIDSYGCRRILAFAPLTYIIASMLCMITPTVEWLIVFRFFQGLGAGLILALAFTSVGKYYDTDKRGKCNELMTGAFAIGSLFSSAAGYFLTDTFNWRFGFILFSLLMFVGFLIAWRFLPETEHSGKRINIGSTLLVAFVFGLATLYTQLVNVNFELISLPSILTLLFIILLALVMLIQMHRSPNSVLPYNNTAFEILLILLMFMFSLCGLGLIQYFFKLYLTYFEFDIYKATSMFLFMLAGAGMTSIVGGRFVYKTGVRPWVMVGSVIVTIGLLFTHFFADKSVTMFGVSLFIFGMGLGCIVTEILCSMQTIVDKKDMGQHTGNLMAVRMVGILAGNAFIGAYINNVIRVNRKEEILDLSASTNIFTDIGEMISSGLEYVANSMDDGFLMTALIMAFITGVLALISYNLGTDDLTILKGLNEESADEKVYDETDE